MHYSGCIWRKPDRRHLAATSSRPLEPRANELQQQKWAAKDHFGFSG